MRARRLKGAALRLILTLQQRVVSGVLVELAQRRVVEARAIEQVGAGFGEHREQSALDDLGRLLADDVDAEQPHVVSPEQQFQEARVVADDAPARVVRVARPARDEVHALAVCSASSVSPTMLTSGIV